MSTVNAIVIEGFTFVLDADGLSQVTVDRLNQLGVPTVSLILTNTINTEDIVDSQVTAAKLADDVADNIIAATITVAAEDSNNIDVTIQAVDVQGNNLSKVVGLQAWISATAGTAPAALPSGGAPAIVTSQGIIIEDMTASAPGTYLTDSNGLLVLRFTEAGALTKYFNAIVQSQLEQGDVAMTWT